MARVAPVIPDEAALLCEGCGYIVSGLPGSGACPECGRPIEQSRPEVRSPPPWESQDHTPTAFIATAGRIVFTPARFYRSIPTRTGLGHSALFARICWVVVCLLFGFAAFLQAYAVFDLVGLDAWASWEYTLRREPGPTWGRIAIGSLAMAVLTYLFLTGITALAARLTAWEAAFRGLRLPLPVVVRGMHYHAAHYLPVAALAAVTVGGYHVLRAYGVIPYTWETPYVYILGAEIVLAAVYLFWTYWIAMRAMMFANA